MKTFLVAEDHHITLVQVIEDLPLAVLYVARGLTVLIHITAMGLNKKGTIAEVVSTLREHYQGTIRRQRRQIHIAVSSQLTSCGIVKDR